MAARLLFTRFVLTKLSAPGFPYRCQGRKQGKRQKLRRESLVKASVFPFAFYLFTFSLPSGRAVTATEVARASAAITAVASAASTAAATTAAKAASTAATAAA